MDTNLVVSSFLSSTGAPRTVLQALYDGRYSAVVTESILREYAEVLNRPVFASKYRVDPSEILGFLEFIRDSAVLVTDAALSPVIARDHLDQKFLDAAHTAKAEFLVTGDNDLLVLDGDPRLGALRIVTARAFLDLLGEE